ncbi:MAG: AAA family ATPase [Oscillospiraceae bacterium]
MSSVYNTKLQERLRAYVAEVGNQSKAAANIGINKTIISLYINSNYGPASDFGKGDLVGTEAKLAEYFLIQDARAQHPTRTSPSRIEDGRYVPTTISEQVYKAIRYCQLEKGIMMLHGDSGIGKTMGAGQYVRDNPSTAIYISVTPTTGALSRFIRALAQKLRIAESRNQWAMVEEIQAKLRGSNKVLIIDEAQNLKYTTMEEIRDWTTPDPIDFTPGIGIVLIGNPEMHRRMSRGRYSDRYDQQENRCRPMPLSRRQITKDDVKKIFPGLDNPEHDAEASYLLAVCRSKCGIRNATHIWNDAVNAKDISSKRLQGIAQGMGIVVA